MGPGRVAQAVLPGIGIEVGPGGGERRRIALPDGVNVYAVPAGREAADLQGQADPTCGLAELGGADRAAVGVPEHYRRSAGALGGGAAGPAGGGEADARRKDAQSHEPVHGCHTSGQNGRVVLARTGRAERIVRPPAAPVHGTDRAHPGRPSFDDPQGRAVP